MPPSCRVAHALTETVRREWPQQSQAELRRITWHVPGLVWSLDDAELARLAGHKLHLHQVQDLASRYKFMPWVGERVLGESVALAWSNCSCGRDRRWCSSATTVPISIIRPSMRC
jgi:hypothetical protein